VYEIKNTQQILNTSSSYKVDKLSIAVTSNGGLTKIIIKMTWFLYDVFVGSFVLNSLCSSQTGIFLVIPLN
jgi:hypothetical protein